MDEKQTTRCRNPQCTSGRIPSCRGLCVPCKILADAGDDAVIATAAPAAFVDCGRFVVDAQSLFPGEDVSRSSLAAAAANIVLDRKQTPDGMAAYASPVHLADTVDYVIDRHPKTDAEGLAKIVAAAMGFTLRPPPDLDSPAALAARIARQRAVAAAHRDSVTRDDCGPAPKSAQELMDQTPEPDDGPGEHRTSNEAPVTPTHEELTMAAPEKCLLDNAKYSVDWKHNGRLSRGLCTNCGFHARHNPDGERGKAALAIRLPSQRAPQRTTPLPHPPPRASRQKDAPDPAACPRAGRSSAMLVAERELGISSSPSATIPGLKELLMQLSVNLDLPTFHHRTGQVLVNPHNGRCVSVDHEAKVRTLNLVPAETAETPA